jgi:predicted N-acetyltransferase YhbS
VRELRELQRLVQDVWRSRKPLVEAHVGDLAWWSREPDRAVRAWRDGGRVVAWGWLLAPDDLSVLVAPGREELVPEVLDAFEAQAVWSLEGDAARIDELERRGYRRDDGPFFVHLARSLDGLPEPQPPPGYTLRAMQGRGDVPRRVEVQRAAFTSTLTEEKYEHLLGTWPYRPDCDLVAEAADGSFASFCTGWLDDENRAGLLEPVGTHPDHGRRGLARSTCLAALWALREQGADTAVVYARGDDAYPGPKRLYLSLGFEPVGCARAYRRDP